MSKESDIDGSRPQEEFTEEEWMFLFAENVEKVVAKGWLSEFLFYELSRELNPEGLAMRNPHSFLQEISGGLFPEKPFLKLGDKDREELLKKMHEPGSFYRSEYLPLENPAIFQFDLMPALTDWAASHLEDHAREAALLEAERINRSKASEPKARKVSSDASTIPVRVTPDDFSPGTNPGERAYVSEKNRMIRDGIEIFEPNQLHLTLHLDLEFQNTTIIKEFTELLERIRRIAPTKEKDQRGKGRKPTAVLRSLANFRLRRALGSYRLVEEFLSRQATQDSPIASEAGWRKSADSGAELVSRFRSKFEVE